MHYAKAVSNMDEENRDSKSNELATLEQIMINKLKSQNLKNGNINDLKSFLL